MKSSLLVIIGLALCVATAAACGKDDGGPAPSASKPSASRPSAPAPSAPAAPADAPDVDAVKAIDCAKACAQDGECIKRHVAVPENHQRDCTQSCDMLKGLYDPARHGAVMKRFITLASGQCAD
jgi:hypothetical protein